MLIIPALGRQEYLEFQTNLGYTVRPCCKERKKGRKKERNNYILTI
jgi:hypothetical protein